MEIVNARIDERLVHGMVSTFWLPSLKVNRVMCIDDASAANPMIKNALRMATPKDIRLSVIPTEKAIEGLKTQKYGAERLMLVAKTPNVYLQLVQAGIPLPEITLGNLGVIHKAPDAVDVTKYLSVTPTDYAIFEELHSRNVALNARLIPDDMPTDFYSAMKAKFKT